MNGLCHGRQLTLHVLPAARVQRLSVESTEQIPMVSAGWTRRGSKPEAASNNRGGSVRTCRNLSPYHRVARVHTTWCLESHAE